MDVMKIGLSSIGIIRNPFRNGGESSFVGKLKL